MATYNSEPYNETAYNLVQFIAVLSESLSESDTITKSAVTVRIDSQASADALSDAASLSAFLDTVSILQRATYGAVYNNLEYNAGMYNRTVDDDEVLLQATKALTDSLSFTDQIGPFLAYKVMSETLAGADVTFFTTGYALIDFMFLSEFFRIEITNKALSDTLRLADWLSIKQNPQSNDWGD